jgi:hypothetical protein
MRGIPAIAKGNRSEKLVFIRDFMVAKTLEMKLFH